MERKEYIRKHSSLIDPYYKDVVQMRVDAWPYEAIAERLKSECDVNISVSAVAKYCKTHGIIKHVGVGSQNSVKNITTSASEEEPKKTKKSPTKKLKNSDQRKSDSSSESKNEPEISPDDLLDDAIDKTKKSNSSFTTM